MQNYMLKIITFIYLMRIHQEYLKMNFFGMERQFLF